MILHDFFSEAANSAQQAAIAIAMRKAGKKPKTESVTNPADTLYFFDVARGGRSFNHLDLKIMGLRQTKSGKWYYQPGRDSTDLLTNASLKHLEKTLNVPARAWQRPVTESPRIARKPGQPADSKKHSDLYTDENPRGTITGLKFATVEDARASVAKIRNSGRSHAHKIQAAVAMEQRARAAGKASEAAVYRAYINANKKTDEGVDLEEACWKGYHKEGMKTMFGKRYPNCVKNKKKNEDVAEGSEQKPVIVYTNHRGATIDDNIKKSLPSTLVPFNKLRMWEKHKSMKDPKIADWVTNKLLPELKQNGVLKPLLVWNDNGQLFVIDGNHRFLAYQVAGYQGRVPVQIVPENMITVSDTLPGQQGVAKDTIQEFVNETLGQKNSDEIRRIQQMLNKKFNANLDVDGVLGPLTKQSIAKFLPSADTAPAPDPKRTTAVQGLKDKSMQEQHCPNCGGPMFSELMINEKQDACYYKVKSRYKVWPSAYASGALVQCRKKGAANWGNKSQ